jgi:hypothetical protein
MQVADIPELERFPCEPEISFYKSIYFNCDYTPELRRVSIDLFAKNPSWV